MFLTKRQREYKKIERVIKSCQTFDQLQVALNMIKLFLDNGYLVDRLIIGFNSLFAKDDYFHPILNIWDNRFDQLQHAYKMKGENNEN